MAKDRGIVIKFNKDLVGDVSGLNPPMVIEAYRLIDFVKGGVEFTSSGSNIRNAFDSSSSTFWSPGQYSNVAKWCQLNFSEDRKKLSRVIIHTKNNYTEILIEGSNDGVVFEQIYRAQKSDTVKTTTFDMETPEAKPAYSIIKFTFTTTSTSLDVYDIKLYERVEIGNEQAFSITGKEYEYPGGPLINSSYVIKSIDRWKPDDNYEDNYIILKLHRLTRMRKPEGPIQISYKKMIGNLQGMGGARIEDFSVEFIPSDLIVLPNPTVEENVKADISLNLNFIKVEQRKFEIEEENIKISPTLNLNFINITGIYP